MAKSSTTIQMEYRKTLAEAENIRREAQSLHVLVTDDMEEIYSTLAKNWKSDYSSDYLRKLSTMTEKLRQESAELRKSSETLKQIAETVRKAEEKAAELAKARTYK